MKRDRMKRKAAKRAVKPAPRGVHAARLLVTVAVAGLVLLIAWPRLFPHKPAVGPAPAPTNRAITLQNINGGLSLPAPPADAAKPDAEELSDDDKAAKCLNLGTDFLNAGRVDEAVAQYREAARLNPENEDAHFNLGVALARQGHPETAKAQYLEALRIYPDYTDADNNLGNLLVAEGKFDEGINLFRAALKVAADEAPTHNNLGKALARQGKIDEAMASFNEALRLKADYPEARFNLAIAYMSEHRTNDGVGELTRLLAQHPDFAPAQRLLAKVSASKP